MHLNKYQSYVGTQDSSSKKIRRLKKVFLANAEKGKDFLQIYWYSIDKPVGKLKAQF